MSRSIENRLRGWPLSVGAVLIGAAAIATNVRSEQADRSPVFGVMLPEGYRDFKLISVAHEAGANNDIRAILGNDIAVQAFRDGTRPFPDGAVIARLAWEYRSSARNDAVFPTPQSFVAGPSTNVQISVKDSNLYVRSGGWGYGQFEKGQANQNTALMHQCLACHAKLDKADDQIFTHWSP